MNRKNTFLSKAAVVLLLLFCGLSNLQAQVAKLKFCDRNYFYGKGNDSITLYFSLLDEDGQRKSDVSQKDLESNLIIKEDGEGVSAANGKYVAVNSGKRIPAEYTFSVLVDQSISEERKDQIYDAISKLVESAPDGCVYISFFGDEVGTTEVVTSETLRSVRRKLKRVDENKFFYSALYAKLCEFSTSSAEFEESMKVEEDYTRNADIAKRAAENPDKNILFVFTEDTKSPDWNDEIDFIAVTEYQNGDSHLVPRVYAFYFHEDGAESNIQLTLEGICNPKDSSRKGSCMAATDVDQVLAQFMQVVSDQMYDYSFTYKATDGKAYTGQVSYAAVWRGDVIGNGDFTIGSAELPWPEREETVTDSAIKYIMAIVIAVLTILIFFLVMKVLVPSMKQSSFKSKYYKRFVPDEAVSRRICTYCRQVIQEGQLVVTRCKHVMHANCWKENGFKCAEYGQNCNEGYQPHIIWSDVFTLRSLMECHQTLAGVLAALISWVIYELIGGSLFDMVSLPIVGAAMSSSSEGVSLVGDCINRTSAFLTIGMLLGFFLSFIFRYNDEYREKNAAIWLKILGLSILTAIIGMIAFAIGAFLFCILVNAVGATYIPWYCSLPAYLLFSISVSLALTIKSTIPMKSALLGGLLSAIIGFLVLSFGSLFTGSWGWMGMLLNFIIYGGGLGAALVTVRMLAEKYFLVFTVGTDTKRIPIHKWMGATGGGNKVNIGMTNNCEIQMNWEKANKVAKQHVQLFIDTDRNLPVLKPLAAGVLYNGRTDLPVNKLVVLCEGDTFKVGDTTFRYTEKMD